MHTRICAVLPLTLDRLGPVKLPELEEPLKVCSLEQAFQLFQPEMDFSLRCEAQGDGFRARHAFRCLDDFLPEQICGLGNQSNEFDSNDLVALEQLIRRLQHLRTAWETDSVRCEDYHTIQLPINRAIGEVVAAERLRFNAVAGLNSRKKHGRLYRVLSLPGVRVSMAGYGQQDTPPPCTLAELDAEINEAVETRDALLSAILREIRPVEMGWRALALLFQSYGNHLRPPDSALELYVFNIDLLNLRSVCSVDLITRFIAKRNGNLTFSDDISILAIPASIPEVWREEFEELADQFGFVLVSDLGRQSGAQSARRKHRPGMYMSSRLRMRAPYWFEAGDSEAGLFMSSALPFAAALSHNGFRYAPTEREWRLPAAAGTGPIMECKVNDDGPMEASVWRLLSENREFLTFQPIELWQVDATTLLDIWRTQSVLSHIEQCITLYATETNFTREGLVELEQKLDRILDLLVAEGRILQHRLLVAKTSDVREAKILRIDLDVQFAEAEAGRSFLLEIRTRGQKAEFMPIAPD